MRIDSISIRDQPPVRLFECSGLSNIVVIAGPNGIGKTRLMTAVLNLLRNPSGGGANAYLKITATSEDEKKLWDTDTLETNNPAHAKLLAKRLQRSQKRGAWTGGVLHFDASRQFTKVQPMKWEWNFTDPTTEDIGWDFTFNPFQARFTDTIHAIYKMLGHHRAEIARRALALQKKGEASMELDFPDPLARFREAFSLLLGPKELADIDIANPQIRYVQNGTTLGIESLSSGEKEAFNIVFDLLLRNPQDCIVFFDEPELHLHPELSFRLLKALQVIGVRNQFVFLTHSSDIISSAIEHSVVFLAPRPEGENQAVVLGTSEEAIDAFKELGQSLGIISLGRRIVLIEGTESSMDRDTYGAIIQAEFPRLVLAPSGSRQTILGFNRVAQDVLSKTLWGIDFFMLADRDNSLPDSVLADLETRASGRLRFLPRLHVENYFLEETVLARVFEDLAPIGDWRRDPAAIRTKLIELATNLVPLAVNRWLGTQLRAVIGEIDISVKHNGCSDPDEFVALLVPRAAAEHARVGAPLDPSNLEAEVKNRWAVLEGALGTDQWKVEFPGKILFKQFANEIGLRSGFLKSAYLAEARRSEKNPFQEISEIFASWDG